MPLTPSLGPGAPPHRKKSARSCRKWSAVALGLLIPLLVFMTIHKFDIPFVDKARHSHRALYRNGSLEDQAVVRPLIDDDQQFDIAVSVWLREEEEEWKRLSSTIDDGEYPDYITFRLPLDTSNKGTLGLYQLVHKYDENYDRYLKGDKNLLYTPLYSDIAFHGVGLKDKNVILVHSGSHRFHQDHRCFTPRLCPGWRIIPEPRSES
ncbi:hypothetical protein DFS33DRAFT_1113222 [Desarmillaria ectypa]|nr:hypothetical protein DFS33DRAFT_1113222 [Desarmillaria ectypa]